MDEGFLPPLRDPCGGSGRVHAADDRRGDWNGDSLSCTAALAEGLRRAGVSGGGIPGYREGFLGDCVATDVPRVDYGTAEAGGRDYSRIQKNCSTNNRSGSCLGVALAASIARHARESSAYLMESAFAHSGGPTGAGVRQAGATNEPCL